MIHLLYLNISIEYSFFLSNCLSTLSLKVFLSNWVSTGAAVSRILVPLLVTFLYYPLGYQPGGDPQHPSSFILFVVIGESAFLSEVMAVDCFIHFILQRA